MVTTIEDPEIIKQACEMRDNGMYVSDIAKELSEQTGARITQMSLWRLFKDEAENTPGTKTIRIASEVLEFLLRSRQDPKESHNSVITRLIEKYGHEEVKLIPDIYEGKKTFYLQFTTIKGREIKTPIKEYTKSKNIIRISEETHNKLELARLYPGESFNNIIIRLCMFSI